MKITSRMISVLIFPVFAIAYNPPSWAEDAQTVMQNMEQKQIQRWSGEQYYVVVKDAVGTRSILLYQRVSPTDPKLGFRLVPPDEIAQRAAGISDHARWLAAGMTFTSLSGLLSSLPDGSVGNQAMAAMTDAFAAAQSGVMQNTIKAKGEAEKSAFDRRRFAQMAKWVALQQFGDRWAHHLRATDINFTQTTAEGSYTLKTADVFVDNEKYVPLKMRFDFQEEKTGNMFSVEKISSDYRSVGSLYEPFKETMRINPGLDGKQAAELEKAQREMAKLKQQLASMPPEQRAMMEQMMGGQMQSMMKTVDNMAAGKGIEVESVVHSFVAQKNEEQAISRYLLEIKRSGLTPAKPN